MSVLRAQGDRGPTESHLLDRFSTTYSTSYRPYEETRRTVPIQCVSTSKSGSGLDTSAHVSRGSRFWPISSESGGGHAANVNLRSGDPAHNTNTSYQPSISRVLNPLNRLAIENGVGLGSGMGTLTRRSWDDTVLATNPALSGLDRLRPRPPGLSGPGTAPYRNSVNVSASDLANGSAGTTPATTTTSSGTVAGNRDSTSRNYTSTYTTVVSDKIAPCFAVSNGSVPHKTVGTGQTDKSALGFCAPSSASGPQPPSSRTGSTVTNGVSGTRADPSCTDFGVNKLSLNPAVGSASGAVSCGAGSGPGVSSAPACGPFSASTSGGPLLSSADRSLSLTTITPYQPFTHFDFGLMFSQIARINDHLYLSSLNALTPDRLRQHGITLLVSAVVDPIPIELRRAVTSQIHVPVEDMEKASLRPHFDRVADRIHSEHRRGGRALVHCMAGVSRSSSLILAYLIRYQNMTLAEAYQHVRAIRPCIRPNPGFWRQLLDYEERVRGTRSVILFPPLGYSSSCSICPTGSSRFFYAATRHTPRSTYLDMFSRNSGDLLPYRPLTTLHSIESSKPYVVGCRQPLG